MTKAAAKLATDFRGSTIVVVGAGRGLGKQYAIDLARSGANVVVTGRSADAQAVANAITGNGGAAVAVRCDIRDPQPFVDAALDRFGAIDGLIVNAGIVRDRSFAKMSDTEWREVIDMHLTGSFACAKAVWEPMATAGKGSIVLTTSGAGMHGAFGQANYAAAKGGVIGLAKTLAIEGARLGIRVNCIAPMALTEMTDAVFTDRMKEGLPADQVSPFILSLLDDRSRLTGAIVECGGGWGAMMRWQRAAGLILPDGGAPLDAIEIQNAMGRFDLGFDHPATTADSLGAAMRDPRTLNKFQ